MDNFKIKDPPEYNEVLRMLETSDRARADIFNILFEQLINNDAFLRKFLEKLEETATKHIEDSDLHVTAQDKQGWNEKAGTTEATQSAAGLMSAGDKKKLDGVAANAEVNQNAYSNIKVGRITISANGKTSTLTLEAGANITISADNAAKKITITATRDGGNADMVDGYHAEHFARADHAHDGRYYTKTESDNLLKQKAASSHSHNNYAQKAIYKDDGVSLERTGAAGSKSIALGAYAVKATGPNSFAAGWLTEATGDTGTTFGYLTKAIGMRSFACGEQTEASGSNSHAEGGGTIASGYNAHAEGDRTTASGSHSHSEGAGTEALGHWSHAEGAGAKASGNYSHAEGYETFCDCLYGGHVEGMSSIAAPTQCWLPIASYSGATLTVDTTKVNYIPTAMAKITAGMDILVWNDYYANKDAYKYQVAAVNVSAKTITLNTALPASNFRVVNAVIPAIRNTKQYYPGHAEGTATRAIGNSSHAEGAGTNASGQASHAEGENTEASAAWGHAEGAGTNASGYDAHAEGSHTTASGDNSHVGGRESSAVSTDSFAHGTGCYAGGWGQAVFGRHNKKTPDSEKNNAGDMFIVGNGHDINNLSNAFRVHYNGMAYVKTAYNTGGADYAELFEWLDNNVNGEDRVGYFVALEDNKVRIASSQDYILGIVSGAPSVIGNSPEDWAGRWKKDVFGRPIKELSKIPVMAHETYEEPILDEDGNETGEYEHRIHEVETGEFTELEHPIVVEDYDSSKPYICRIDRPEWAAIGMLGVLAVYDDGSCQVNGYCKVADGGIATAVDSEYMLVEGKILRGYRVIERVAENIIKVVFR